MKTIIKTITISILILAAIAGGGYWFIQDFTSNDGEDIAEVANQIDQQDVSTETEEVSDAAADGKPGAEMLEGKLQTYLHQMTHQKIVASEKRGAVEMSEENIANMLKIVRANKQFYEQGDFYEETLMAWEKGDFSNAVIVHNTIWEWHKGTVGRATGLMSSEQEKEYVEKNFR